MEQEKMLREILAISRENRDMINAINTQRRFSNLFWIIKWIIVLGLLYGTYQAVMPQVTNMLDAVNNITGRSQPKEENQSVMNSLFQKIISF